MLAGEAPLQLSSATDLADLPSQRWTGLLVVNGDDPMAKAVYEMQSSNGVGHLHSCMERHKGAGTVSGPIGSLSMQ